jgi:hypothetical protein
MLRSWPAALLLSALLSSFAPAAADPPLTVDTPVQKLLADPRTKPVIEKHLSKLAQRLAADQEAAEFFGPASPRELAADRHVRGITQEILDALQADLLAAQELRPSPR